MRRFDFFIVPFLMDATVSCGWLLANYYAQDLGASKLQIGVRDFAWGVVYMPACLIVGRLVRRVASHVLIIAGITVQGLSAWLNGFCHTPNQIIALSFFNGLGCALFWPVFMALLHDKEAVETNRRLGAFNLGWTTGLSVGMAVSGTLAQWNARVGFHLIGVAAAVNLLYFWRARCSSVQGCVCASNDSRTSAPERPQTEPLAHPRTRTPQRPHTSTPKYPNTRRLSLYLAWCSCFLLFFASAAATNQFPVLARLLHIPDKVSSLLVSVNIIGLSVGSWLMSRTTQWHDRLAPILGAMTLAACALGLLLVAQSPVIFAIGWLLLGGARAVVYVASLYYGLHSHLPKAIATSIHETLIGAAFTFGPLVAGGLAQLFTPRAPIAFSLCSILAATGVIAAGWRMKR
ncbi:MAG: MFS transporter [Abditibacteriales bacterium]|nr:MFS transporter [Abditibacteriales bacterium]MDW8364422.1 MFS transporter [Abditibacteriales bacterium]